VGGGGGTAAPVKIGGAHSLSSPFYPLPSFPFLSPPPFFLPLPSSPFSTRESIGEARGSGGQRSGNFERDLPILAKIGAGGRIPRSLSLFLFGKPRNLATTVVRCPVDESGRTFSKIFTLGVICRQNLKLKLSQTGTSLRAGYRSQDALQLQKDTVYSTL